MLEKIQEKQDAILKLAGENEAKLQQYLDGLDAIEMQLTDDEATAVDGDPKGLGGGGIRNPR